ncbi:MAG: DNA polymerase III subunit beta [Patescibacteria group bacterium]
MKLSCTKENLHQGLAVVSHLSAKNANLPILNNVLLRADVGGVRLTATNLDLTVTCQVRGKVDQPGEYTLPSRLFSDYVSLLPDERVDLDLLDTALSVVCGASKTKINGMSSGEFPLVPQISGGTKFMIPVAALEIALSRTLFAVATSEARQVLTGVFMNFVGETKSLTVAATDSYRLGESVISLKGEVMGERRVIIPARTMAELRRIIGVLKDSAEMPAELEVELTDNQVAFRYGSAELLSRTLDGVYPPYQEIIPKHAKTEITVNRVAFMQAVKRTSLFSKAGLFDVRLEVKAGGNQVELSATDAGRGENSVAVDAEITGEDNIATLNYRYLLDGVGAIGSEKVVLKLIDAVSPCVVVPKEEAGQPYVYIVMPIRQ